MGPGVDWILDNRLQLNQSGLPLLLSDSFPGCPSPPAQSRVLQCVAAAVLCVQSCELFFFSSHPGRLGSIFKSPRRLSPRRLIVLRAGPGHFFLSGSLSVWLGIFFPTISSRPVGVRVSCTDHRALEHWEGRTSFCSYREKCGIGGEKVSSSKCLWAPRWIPTAHIAGVSPRFSLPIHGKVGRSFKFSPNPNVLT